MKRNVSLTVVPAIIALALASVMAVVVVKGSPGTFHLLKSPPAKAVSTSPSVAPVPAAPGVEVSGPEIYYTVQKFDVENHEGTLTYIADRFGTSVDQLVAWNGIKDRNLIYPGQRLRVR